MRRHVWIGMVVGTLLAGGRGLRAEPTCCEPSQDCFLKRLGPVGGWHAYDSGLLTWWPRHCFPCCGATDDYCRKPLPSVCWPSYPSYYIWGTPETSYPQGCCRPASREPH